MPRSPLGPPPRHRETRIIPPEVRRHGLGGCVVLAALPIAGNAGNEPHGRRSEPVRLVGDERPSVAIAGWTIRHPHISCPFLQSCHVLASARSGSGMSGNLERPAVPERGVKSEPPQGGDGGPPSAGDGSGIAPASSSALSTSCSSAGSGRSGEPAGSVGVMPEQYRGLVGCKGVFGPWGPIRTLAVVSGPMREDESAMPPETRSESSRVVLRSQRHKGHAMVGRRAKPG